jgi:hypothetical protein
MKRVSCGLLAVAAPAVFLALAEPCRAQATHRRFLDYLPVGTYLTLSYPTQGSDSYQVQILTAKQVEERPADYARIEKIRKELAEIDKRRDDKDSSRRNELLTALRQSQLGRRAGPVYEVIAVGDDFVELRARLSATAQKVEVQSGMVLPAARIREIRLPAPTDRQKDRPR